MPAQFLAPPPNQIRLTGSVIRTHQRGIWRYLRFLGADPSTADDLTQDTFLKVLRSPPQDRGSSALARWLRRTALNLFRSSNRRARAGFSLEEAEVELIWQQYSTTTQGDEYVDALERCLQELPEQQRMAIELRYRENASRAEIATALRVTPEGAKTALRRSRARLHRCIEARMARATGTEDDDS